MMRINTDNRRLDEASRDILSTLAEQIGLDVWTVCQREGDELHVVALAGTGLEIERGSTHPWGESLCARMVTGASPGAAPDLAAVPAYASAPVVRALGLGAYIGAPLLVEGETVGTLCGLSRAAQPPELLDRLPLVQLCARLLGRLWTSERTAATDRLTGLANRRALEEALEHEEQRCRRFGLAAAVLAVDVDSLKAVNDHHGYAAGDEHLRRAGGAIGGAVRAHDLVARWGGDEFCVLAVECDQSTAERLVHRVRLRLAAAGVPSSVAIATRRGDGLASAFEVAFGEVQREKGTRRSDREHAPGSDEPRL